MSLPTGPRVTFLFTDIEGSTRHERAVGSIRWAAIVARHDALLRRAIERRGGVVVKTEGDAFFAAFDDPNRAIAAAVDGQRALAAESWPQDGPLRVRMGLHLGEGRLRAASPSEQDDYVGIDVNYAARVSAAGNGGQIVLSDAVVGAIGRDLDRGELAGVELVDEGLRILKDFEEPARLHRLVVPGAADDPRRLRTVDPPSNLPGEVTTLVGRELEIALAREALIESRIVTMTGPGGSGKTRLALAVARSLTDRFPHGTWFVDLAVLHEASLLESAVASAIGLRESRDQTISEVLRATLRDRSALLLLDNVEQLLPRAADIVSAILRAAPEIRVLATSRELLRIAGERAYPVPSLDTSAGVALFQDRARVHRPDLLVAGDALDAVRAICERLGGLPLAIELAAARVRTLSPVQILDRLGRSLDLTTGARDVPERQRTLRAAIDWSHDLLSEPERRLFRRLGVFAGGWTIPTAEAVVDPDGDLGIDLVDGLESLGDKSLIRAEPPSGGAGEPEEELRFGHHPLLREYALERLAETGERALTEARHADVFAELAVRLGPDINGVRAAATLTALDREAFNLRTAVEWSLDNDQADLGLRLIGAIWRWYQQHGHLREGRAQLAELLGREPGEIVVRIGGLAAEGGLAYWMNDVPGAQVAYDARLALAESADDPELLAWAHYDLGFLSMMNRDGPGLRRHEERALELFEAVGNVAGALRARQALVLSIFVDGDYARAGELEEQNLAVFRRESSRNEIADSLTFFSAVHFKKDEPVASWSRLQEGLRMFVETNNMSGLARSIGMAAIIRFHFDDPEFGARLAGSAYEMVRQHDVMMAPVQVLHLPDPRELAVERLGEERGRQLLETGAATPLAEVIAEILDAPPPGPGGADSGAAAEPRAEASRPV